MKKFKQLMLCVTAIVSLCFVFSNVLTVSAVTYQDEVAGNVYVEPYHNAKGQLKNLSKMRMTVDEIDTFSVDYGNGDKIANLKSSKSKNLEVAQVYSYNSGDVTGSARISLHANKAGTYTVSFDVVRSDGSKRGNYKVKVQVVNDSSLLKKATFGKQTITSSTTKVKSGTVTSTYTNSYKVNGKSGKLKLTANSQYKITGIVVVTVNKNGKYSYKKVKNGKNITLSQARSYTNTSADGRYSRPSSKRTYICISYKDKFFGNSVTYSVTSKRGRKEVKCVSKYGQTGETYTSYDVCPDGAITLYQY
jgi:methionine-rich copper-binding protein CopC